jgi:hypothetical protein
MSKKRRAPIEQLREAGKIARQLLVDRGIITKESTIDQLLQLENSPTLPGIPAYLPHQWTIQASIRIMRDLIVMWKEYSIKEKIEPEDLTAFFKFIIKELRLEEKKFTKEMKNVPKLIKSMKEVPVLKDVFSPMRKRDGMRAIHRFFIDSFAVAVALKKHSSVSEYANWYLDWAQDLDALWSKPMDRDKLKRA